MVFNSYLFILVFMPLFLLTFFAASRFGKGNNISYLVILAFSLAFCARVGYEDAVFIVVEVLINYLFYLILRKKKSKAFLGIFIAANVMFLGVFKYTDMAISVFNMVMHTNISVTNIQAPLGISFITFQQIAFLVYVYKNPDFKAEILPYSAFVSFFPHVLSGPILYAEEFWNQLKEKIGRVDWDNMSSGLLLFSIGMAKKVLLADVYGKMVDAGYLAIESMNVGSALFVSVAYSLQIYFDFCGYCDMAMGIGRMINIELPVNFNSPYKAATIDEFWDRWHMTLTRFLTRFVYIPLGGNRKGVLRTYINIMLVFLLSGLWHGASLTFVLWGFVHGFAMVISRLGRNAIKKVPRVITQVVTLVFVNFAWVIFRVGTFSTMRQMISAFMRPGFNLISEISDAFEKIGFINVDFGNKAILALVFVLFGLFVCLVPKNSLELTEKCKFRGYSAVFAALLLIFCVLSFSGTATYIYLRF